MLVDQKKIIEHELVSRLQQIISNCMYSKVSVFHCDNYIYLHIITTFLNSLRMHHHLVDIRLFRRIQTNQFRPDGVVDILDRSKASLSQIP